MKDKVTEICRILHISALSQALIEEIEQSIFDKEFKHEAVKKGKEFINILDKKLNIMLDINDKDSKADIQLLDYVTVLINNHKKVSYETHKELAKVLNKEYKINDDNTVSTRE